jgi:hypothetical protein
MDLCAHACLAAATPRPPCQSRWCQRQRGRWHSHSLSPPGCRRRRRLGRTRTRTTRTLRSTSPTRTRRRHPPPPWPSRAGRSARVPVRAGLGTPSAAGRAVWRPSWAATGGPEATPVPKRQRRGGSFSDPHGTVGAWEGADRGKVGATAKVLGHGHRHVEVEHHVPPSARHKHSLARPLQQVHRRRVRPVRRLCKGMCENMCVACQHRPMPCITRGIASATAATAHLGQRVDVGEP